MRKFSVPVRFQTRAHSSSIQRRGIAASPGTVSVLDRSGALRLALGATLSIGRQQAPGAYRGSYTVIVDY